MPRLNEREVSEKDFAKYVRDVTNGALITDYPKMLYRAGKPAHGTHQHIENVLAIGAGNEFMTVENADEELAALEDGWSTTPVTATLEKGARRGG